MPTPKDVGQLLSSPDATQRRQQAALQKAFDDGVIQGRTEARKEYLDWLHQRYMGDDVERGSVLGTALLKITKEMAEHFRADTERAARTSAKKRGLRR